MLIQRYGSEMGELTYEKLILGNEILVDALVNVPCEDGLILLKKLRVEHLEKEDEEYLLKIVEAYNLRKYHVWATDEMIVLFLQKNISANVLDMMKQP